MTIGDRIRIARERLGIRQKDVGAAIGKSEQSVSQYERGVDTLPIDKALPLARVLQVPVEWLLDGAGDPPDLRDPQMRFERLSPSSRTVIETLMDTLEKQQSGVA